MKKIFSMLGFVLTMPICNGQTNIFPADGSVGIGTINPVANLHVGKRESSVPGGEVNIDRIAIQPYYHTGGPWFVNSRDVPSNKAYLDIKYGNNRIYTIDHTGNVGIGITLPSEKLSVNGKIRAKEIKVENANWPDYVFSKKYKLPSLKRIELFIRENGHLEGMPSAKQVQQNGVELGKTQAVLLQKVEEITLHLIEMNKRIEQLEQENQLLKRK